MRDDNWDHDVTNAITHGECVFGWQPPETERPFVSQGHEKLGSSAKSSSQCVQLVLNRYEVRFDVLSVTDGRASTRDRDDEAVRLRMS